MNKNSFKAFCEKVAKEGITKDGKWSVQHNLDLSALRYVTHADHPHVVGTITDDWKFNFLHKEPALEAPEQGASKERKSGFHAPTEDVSEEDKFEEPHW